MRHFYCCCSQNLAKKQLIYAKMPFLPQTVQQSRVQQGFWFQPYRSLGKVKWFSLKISPSPRQHRHGCGCSIAYHHFRTLGIESMYTHEALKHKYPKYVVFFSMKIPFSQQSSFSVFLCKKLPGSEFIQIHCISFRTRGHAEKLGFFKSHGFFSRPF